MLLFRALVLVLLGFVSRNIAALYVCVDVGIYLLYKCLRDDFFYWMPLEGWLELVVSLLCRIMTKVIADFTSNGEHARNVMQ